MKTFFQLVVLLLISHFCFAQQSQVNSVLPVAPPSMPPLLPAKLQNPEMLKNYKTPPDRDYFTGWLNYALEFDTAINGGVGANFEPLLLFPDSNIIYYTSAGDTFTPHYHAAATILDPYNMLQQTETLTQGASYTLDSITFSYAYIRNLDTALVVDTLIVDVVKNYAGFWYSTLTNSGDTVEWKFVPYNYLTNDVPDSAVWVRMKFPMKSMFDTVQELPGNVDELKLLQHAIPIPSSVPLISYPDVVGVAISYKPGYSNYSYANHDSLTSYNSFFLGSSYEESGGVQTPNPLGDFNNSYVATNTNAYYDTAGSNYNFAIQFYPAIGYAPFPFQNHIILFHITSNNLGVKNLSISNGLNFYPNPTSGAANFNYSLGRNAQVSLKIFDVTGKEVQDIDEGNQAAGSHNLQINTEGMTSGIYFYSFTVGGQVNNGKFIVD